MLDLIFVASQSLNCGFNKKTGYSLLAISITRSSKKNYDLLLTPVFSFTENLFRSNDGVGNVR